MTRPGFDMIRSPFVRLSALLGDIAPGAEPIDMTIGEPRHPMPAGVGDLIRAAAAGFARYPAVAGTPDLRAAIADWIAGRYGIHLDADREIIALNGSREGLFSATLAALDRGRRSARDAVLIPDPFYQTYLAGAIAAGAEPVFLAARRESGFLPDLDELAANEVLLARTAALFLCSPSNPQGAVAEAAYLTKAIDLARRHDFLLFADECYSEIYSHEAPVGALEVAAGSGDGPANVVVFNSLSKRSSLPGLRSGFAAGDGDFLARLTGFRNVAAPQVPLPIQHVSAAIWRDEAHVEANRRLYSAKFDTADALLGDRYGYRRPAGGFFLWLEMSQFGGGERAAVTLWQQSGVKVLPGSYLAVHDEDGTGPAYGYVRLALVHDLETTATALQRLVDQLGRQVVDQ